MYTSDVPCGAITKLTGVDVMPVGKSEKMPSVVTGSKTASTEYVPAANLDVVYVATPPEPICAVPINWPDVVKN